MPIFLVSFFIFFSSSCFASAFGQLTNNILGNDEHIEYENKIIGGAHQIILSSPKRINNELFLEKEKRVNGDLNIVLVNLSPANTLKEYFHIFESFIKENGRLEYQCQQRGCGVSSYWANNLFNERRLSGRDSDQYYISGIVNMGGVDYWLSTYLVSNALRENLVYVRYIKHVSKDTAWTNGYLVHANDVIPNDVLNSLVNQLKEQPELDLFVVAYVDGQRIKNFTEMKYLVDAQFKVLQKELSDSLDLDLLRVHLHFTGPFHTDTSAGNSMVWFKLFLFSK
jgi:hypothetical protein